MNSQLAMSVMNVAEFALWATLGFLFWKRKFYRRFPSMAAYLALHAASMPMLLAGFYCKGNLGAVTTTSCTSLPTGRSILPAPCFCCFVSVEVFRSALSALPGLMKIGIVIFRWAILVSVVLTFSSMSFTHRGLAAVPDIAVGFMRSVSVVELCLLAFLCLSMNALRLSVRDMAFGIALGFGIMSSNDFVLAAMIGKTSPMTSFMQFVYEGIILVTLGLWVVYYALPEPVRKPLTVPANSTIYRWNEIASALGHTGTQIAVSQPANSFFLTDVEKVVEKVLTRNLKGRESES